MVVALVGFTKEKTWRWPGRSIGVVHGICQLLLALPVVFAALRLLAATWFPFHDRFPRDPIALGLAMVLGAFLGTLLFAAYLALADTQGKFGVNSNELFAGMAITDFKCFLRLHLDHASGDLTVYPIKVERTPAWRFNVSPAGSPLPPEAPWFVPAAEIGYELIEPPIKVSRAPQPVQP